MVAIEFSRRREHELSVLRTFVKLIMFDYKRARQSRRQSVRIQSALCEVACEKNSCGLKILAIHIYGTSVVESKITNSCGRRITNK